MITTSKMERFVIIVNSWKPLTIITKRSSLDFAASLGPHLVRKQSKATILVIILPVVFIEKCDICNFADDNTMYKSSPNLPVVLNCFIK